MVAYIERVVSLIGRLRPLFCVGEKDVLKLKSSKHHIIRHNFLIPCVICL